MNLLDGNGLFVKYWNMQESFINPVWNRTTLLGKNEGVSGSSVGLYNIGLNRHISQERKEYAAEIIKFITSWDIQKKYIVSHYNMFSGISKLFEDPEVCQDFDCELAKKIQAIARPSSVTDDYDEYSTEYRRYLSEFLYGKQGAEETLQKIINISKIYTVILQRSMVNILLLNAI
ncbi:hypothetical protein PIROE2DRAFT_59258 [Piromyces sp. E2]|nr:hypothetical protein PIROE2DRAFT_59258 [Piromyces sp. E2]|eukprot:OUM66677.1 hypothetical protein PIROE2DRAFT_59258 [Piromyces sp. E2]